MTSTPGLHSDQISWAALPIRLSGVEENLQVRVLIKPCQDFRDELDQGPAEILLGTNIIKLVLSDVMD